MREHSPARIELLLLLSTNVVPTLGRLVFFLGSLACKFDADIHKQRFTNDLQRAGHFRIAPKKITVKLKPSGENAAAVNLFRG